MAQAATKNQTPANTANETETEEKKVERTPFTFTVVDKTNMKALATAIWAGIEGENFKDRHDALQEVFEAIRNERDSNKSTRPRKELEVVLKEAIGKPMGDLQAVKVPLAGITVNIPSLVKLATSKEDSPLKAEAVKFMKDHKLTVEKKKVSSKGKESTFLQAA